jgi:hypothetical protein
MMGHFYKRVSQSHNIKKRASEQCIALFVHRIDLASKRLSTP